MKQPKLFLFDEPLSNLDAKLRVRMRVELLNLHYETRNTAVYVTHDQVEAMTMADKIVILNDGYIEQIGSPMNVYDEPANKFVAGFIGSPQMNFLSCLAGPATAKGVECSAKGLGTLAFPIRPETWKEGESISIGVRPEHIDLEPEEPGISLKGVVIIVENLGGETYLHVEIAPGMQLMTKLHGHHGPARGHRVSLHIPADRIYLFDKEDRRISVTPGK